MYHGETNPHFEIPLHPQLQDQQHAQQPPRRHGPQPQLQNQHEQPPRTRFPIQDKRSRPLDPPIGRPHYQDKQHSRSPGNHDQHWPLDPTIGHPRYQDKHHPKSPGDHDQHSRPVDLLVGHSRNQDKLHHPELHDHQHHDQLSQPNSSQHRDQHNQSHSRNQPQHGPHHRDRHHRSHGLHMPIPRETNPLMWFAAIFCAIFWVIIIVGGLIVLIVYLVFRPKSPRFDVSTATLNAAYLDMGYLLNADMTLLANFTNPNQKVSVDFSYMILNLYYGNTLIATQYIDPFSASKGEYRIANVHMVSSQVRLPILQSQRLKKQIETNGVVFDVRGFFRARSNFGGLLKYSYWLYSHCSLTVASPPNGVLIKSKCRTKR